MSKIPVVLALGFYPPSASHLAPADVDTGGIDLIALTAEVVASAAAAVGLAAVVEHRCALQQRRAVSVEDAAVAGAADVGLTAVVLHRARKLKILASANGADAAAAWADDVMRRLRA